MVRKQQATWSLREREGGREAGRGRGDEDGYSISPELLEPLPGQRSGPLIIIWQTSLSLFPFPFQCRMKVVKGKMEIKAMMNAVEE